MAKKKGPKKHAKNCVECGRNYRGTSVQKYCSQDCREAVEKKKAKERAAERKGETIDEMTMTRKWEPRFNLEIYSTDVATLRRKLAPRIAAIEALVADIKETLE
jgi:hypothetical protein